jgi:hypothetical protein
MKTKRWQFDGYPTYKSEQQIILCNRITFILLLEFAVIRCSYWDPKRFTGAYDEVERFLLVSKISSASFVYPCVTSFVILYPSKMSHKIIIYSLSIDIYYNFTFIIKFIALFSISNKQNKKLNLLVFVCSVFLS